MSQELYQFFHNETASLERGRRGKKPTADMCFSEFIRKPGFEAHVKKSRLPKKPIPPIIHFNEIPKEAFEAFAEAAKKSGKTDPADLVPEHPAFAISAYIRKMMEQSEKLNGRKMQRNSQLLLCPAISYPKTIKTVRKSREEFDTYRAWIADVITFAKNEWPGQFVLCGEHIDEKNGHLHLYGLPKFEGNRLTLGKAHPGQHAARLAPTGKRQAYIEAMEAQQDRFYEQVSVKYGHKRRRPVPGPRLTRREWKLADELEGTKTELDAERVKRERLERLLAAHGITDGGDGEASDNAIDNADDNAIDNAMKRFTPQTSGRRPGLR